MKEIEVVAAILMRDQQVFCCQRNDNSYLGKKWELPGGKIERDETQEEALKREIKEELSIEIKIDDFFMTIEHQYEKFHLTMHTYLCTPLSDDLSINVHKNGLWLPINDLLTLDWLEADIPIVEKLIDHIK